jgi:hypothetical protein
MQFDIDAKLHVLTEGLSELKCDSHRKEAICDVIASEIKGGSTGVVLSILAFPGLMRSEAGNCVSTPVSTQFPSRIRSFKSQYQVAK